MKLNLTDLSVLIPIIERELDGIHKTIENGSEDESNDAADLSVLVGNVATKLQDQYEEQWSEDSNFPNYKAMTMKC